MVPIELTNKVKQIFIKGSSRNRKAVQIGLARLKLYSGNIDGKWGSQTEKAIRKVFEELNKAFPDQSYIQKFGFDKKEYLTSDFIRFYNSIFPRNNKNKGFDCGLSSVLSTTSFCIAKNSVGP